jgi:peptidoglycan/LPS O-acetylase OafA/YrhL
MTSGSRWSQLDSLRALAALGVFAFHLAFVYGILLGRELPVVGSDLTPYVRQFGDAGVSVFFVLSAFLIYRPFAAARFESNRMPSIGLYSVRRVLRIFPAYWVALIAVTIVLGTKGVFGWNLPVFAGLLQAYDGDTIAGGIGQAWTLTVEVAFYALVPVWALLLSRVPARTTRSFLMSELGLIALVAALSVVWKLVALQSLDDGSSPFTPALVSLPSFFDHFAAGMLLAVLTVAQPDKLRLVPPWLGWVIAAGALWGMAQAPAEIDGWGAQYLIHRELEVVLGLAVVSSGLALTERRTVSARLLATRPLVWMGVISYGFYLWHLAVLTQLFKWTGTSLGLVPFALIALAASIALGAASWYVIERPAIRFAHEWTSRRRRRATVSPMPRSESGPTLADRKVS